MPRHHRNHDNYTIAWWKREVGGAPVWMLIAALLITAGIVVYVFLNRS